MNTPELLRLTTHPKNNLSPKWVEENVKNEYYQPQFSNEKLYQRKKDNFNKVKMCILLNSESTLD